MEKFQELRDNAKKRLQVADHILTMTYPVAKDPRLLLTVVENLFLSLTSSMGSILHYERTFKRVPPFNDTFNSKLSLFQTYAEKNKIDKKYIKLMKILKEIIISHKKSPIEFSRKDQFIICNSDYDIQKISITDLKDYVSSSKSFFKKAQEIISKDEGLFAR